MDALDDKLVSRLYAAAKAERWHLPAAPFRDALEVSAAKAFSGREPAAREVEKYFASLHLEDLALACACAAGIDTAWEAIVLEHRPSLYRAADALDRSGGAREIADSLYGELYARSLFRYFHGRSSLATWLRSVLAQRYVDAVRARKRLEPLPDGEIAMAPVASADASVGVADPAVMLTFERALRSAVDALPARDRLRLGCYYAQDLTLAETGRALREHEATVSRHLSRSRKAIRAHVEQLLRERFGWNRDDIAACIEQSVENSGELDLRRVLSPAAERKISEQDRSQ